MFKATQPFNDKITNYPKEPSLRIGRTVPDNAVNLAYYSNPTATDAEKVLTSEAPRNTIDHRVEEAYRYLFNQASDDDELFPGSVRYEDEEGYVGDLGRMYVNWYPEAHIETKNVQQEKTIHVKDKSDIPKMIEYSDSAGYSGNLYLDATQFEVHETKDVTSYTNLDRLVLNHELNYYEVFKKYVDFRSVTDWCSEPANGSTYWPSKIIVYADRYETEDGHVSVRNFVSKSDPKEYEGAIGILTFESVQYEPVKGEAGTDGKISTKKSIPEPMVKSVKPTGVGDIDGDGTEELYLTSKDVTKAFVNSYNARYSTTTHMYDYTEIKAFINAMPSTGWDKAKQEIEEAMDGIHDISIFIDSGKSNGNYVSENGETFGSNNANDNGKFEVKMSYAYRIASIGNAGQNKYNVVANYSGTLIKTVEDIKTVADCYKAKSTYVGIARKVWYDYDGVAYYRGAVTKGNGVGNVNPSDDNEILMYSDEDGYLRRPVEHISETGELVIKNYYRVEADYVYLTDVFKNNIACFYKYKLKKPIYDYRGPDTNGFYEGNAVKLYTSGLKDIPLNYEYNMKLKIADTETVSDITDDFNIVYKDIPKRYNAELYTSFISCSTDTFKVTYNAFNDDDENNVMIDNGIIEEIYNYPFMYDGVDFILESVNPKERLNRIRLTNGPYRLYDSRKYVTFTYKVVATKKGTVKTDDTKNTVIDKRPVVIYSEPITVSILNKDYALPAEYNKFEGRGMIISPFENSEYLSPMDIILRDQAARRDETQIVRTDTDYVFSTEIIEIANENIGGVNIKCEPNGIGYITAETTIDTGFIEDKTIDLWSITPETEITYSGDASYTRKLTLDNPYYIEKGYIYPGIKVKCIDNRYIKVNPPRQDGLLDSWYPLLQFGHYSQILDQHGTHIKVCYTMPEYDEQHWGKYGKPIVDIQEESVTVLNSHMVKLSCYPIFIKEGETTVALFKKIDNEYYRINIRDISFSDGIIITKDTISENDNIVCNYSYVEESYVYRGYWRNKDDFARIDLNPNIYHTYSDLNYIPSEEKPTKNLFNKVIYFFMKPTVEYEVSAENDSLVFDIEDDTTGVVIAENTNTIYHKINNAQPDSDHDIYIGSVYIRQNTSLYSTIVVDSRTRGGGIIESMKDSLRKQLEPESDYYLDIGYYDGEPYQENGVIIVRLDNSLLKEFGGRFTQGDIETKVKRWLGYGVYPIIEYVDSYSKRDMPQYNLEIENSYTNIIDETPEILLECESVS